MTLFICDLHHENGVHEWSHKHPTFEAACAWAEDKREEFPYAVEIDVIRLEKEIQPGVVDCEEIVATF